MLFFTTPERMEIGDIPMTAMGSKPTRAEALKYYRRAVDHFGVEAACTSGSSESAAGTAISSSTQRRREWRGARVSRQEVILATGYYDRPNPLDIPGEDLPHVSHYFTDPHPYWEQNVVVIGAKNSAAEAALDLFRGGRARHADSSRRGVGQKSEILGEAGYREPHRGRRNQGAVSTAM